MTVVSNRSTMFVDGFKQGISIRLGESVTILLS
jgi:hypothetical protein